MRISDHCFGITGLSAETPWAVNSGFVVGKHSTLIVDTGSNYLSAQTIFGYSQSVASSNTFLVVNTEPHFDHMGGNSFFSDRGINIFSHPEIKRTEAEFNQTKKEFNDTIPNKARKDANEAEAFFYKTKLANPNKPISHNDVFDLGDVTVKTVKTPGHTPFNISLFVEPDGVLFCGDCMVKDYIPNLEIGDQNDWQNWLQSLEVIEELNPTAVVPGHGDIILGKAETRKVIADMKHVLSTAIKETRAPTH